MIGIAEGTARRASPADREELLRQAVQRSVILRQLMRRTVQQLRAEAAADCAAREQLGGAQEESATDLGPAQFYVLHVLVHFGPLAVGQIAERCHVSRPAISRMLRHLEADGLIERHIDPANRRVTRVAVTDAGRAAQDEMIGRFEAALGRVLSPLTDAELADLITAFGHLERLVACDGSTSPRSE